MRKVLYVFLTLFVGIVAIFILSYKKKEFVSFKDVVVAQYKDNAQNQKVSADFTRIIKDNKWGIARKKNGELVLKPEYDSIDDFYEGYAVIKKDGKYGAIDEQFDVIIKPEWNYISQFHLGYATIIAKNGKSGVIDVNGNIIIKPLYYDYISSFDNNFVAIAKNIKDNKEVLIDIKGNVINQQ